MDYWVDILFKISCTDIKYVQKVVQVLIVSFLL